MIDGFDGDRGAVTAGGRGYYLKVLNCLLMSLLLFLLSLLYGGENHRKSAACESHEY
jgi:hypothetical protein